MAKQLSFIGSGFKKPSARFGGSLLNGNNAKTKRPLDSKLPIHLVLRASQGGMRLPKAFGRIEQIITHAARKHGVRIYEKVNVGNHIHLVIRITGRKLWSAFIREVTGGIAQLMRALKIFTKTSKYWLYRPFTRLLSDWRKSFKLLKEYIYLNRLEADGFISRRETRNLKDLREIWADTGPGLGAA